MGVLDQIYDDYPDQEFLKADGFDNCIIGIDNVTYRLIYSIPLVIEALINDQGMDEEEAWEWYYFNIEGAYMGEQTPIWAQPYK